MAKSLSFVLRSSVRSASEGGVSCRQAAAHFGVSASSAIRWQALRRAGGDARPKPQGGDRLSRRTDAHASLMDTLAELRVRLAAQGAATSVSALWRYFRPTASRAKKTTHAVEQDRPHVLSRRQT